MTFFDKYTYKQKNYALMILAVLLVAVAYKRAFSTTFETKGYQTELEQKLERASTADHDIRLGQAKLAHLNRMLGEENNSVERVQQGFLNFFAQKADGLAVHEVSEVMHFDHPDFSINTHRVVLKGGYLKTLDFLYALEKEFRLAKVLNVSFEFKRYNSNEEKSLYTTILIQNYLR